jgi:hypothetical protein
MANGLSRNIVKIILCFLTDKVDSGLRKFTLKGKFSKGRHTDLSCRVCFFSVKIKLGLESDFLSVLTHQYRKMRIITNFISFLALFFLVGDVLAERHENIPVISVNNGMTSYNNISSAVTDSGFSDNNVQQLFLDAGVVKTDKGCSVDRLSGMCGIPDNVLLGILLDYECRAP